MKQQNLNHHMEANSIVLIEGLEERRLMSFSAIGGPTSASIDEGTHQVTIAVALRSETAGISAGSKLSPRDGSAFSTPSIDRQAKATTALFSANLLPSPATDNVLVAAIGEQSVTPSVATRASNRGSRSLSVSSAHSFAGRPPRRDQNRAPSSSRGRGRVLLVEDDPSTSRCFP